MGPASAYAAVLQGIDYDINALINTHPQYFTFGNIHDGTASVRDFQTTGVVAFAKGLPFSHLRSGKQAINGHRVQVKEDYRQQVMASVNTMVAKL